MAKGRKKQVTISKHGKPIRALEQTHQNLSSCELGSRALYLAIAKYALRHQPTSAVACQAKADGVKL